MITSAFVSGFTGLTTEYFHLPKTLVFIKQTRARRNQVLKGAGGMVTGTLSSVDHVAVLMASKDAPVRRCNKAFLVSGCGDGWLW